MNDRHTVRCAVYGFFIKNKKILMLLRKGTGWMDGKYGVPAGHLDKGESIKGAAIREIKEEVGLDINESDLTLYHVMHRFEDDNFEYIDFFFKVEYFEGEPKNSEPDKASEIKWFDLDALPKNIIPNVKAGIGYYKNKMFFSEFR